MRTTPSSEPSPPMGASAETLREARPPAARSPRSSSPRPRTIIRGPGAPGSVRVLRLGMAEASALMPMPLRCLTNWPTERFLASTLPFILWEWCGGWGWG